MNSITFLYCEYRATFFINCHKTKKKNNNYSCINYDCKISNLCKDPFMHKQCDIIYYNNDIP